ncbi:hypothetical protein BH24CHL4_BH24CHL4_22010 [soil metagenome]
MSASDGDDHFLEIELRPPEQIARRLLVLTAVVQRVVVEHDFKSDEPPGQNVDDRLFDLRASLSLSGADQELTAAESALIASPAGRVLEDTQYAFGWDIEAISAILAATGLIDEPPPPLLTDIRVVEAIFAEDGLTVGNLAARLRLPGDEYAARAREIAELWLWRASTEREIRESAAPEREHLRTQVREVATEAAAAGLIEMTSTGDFEIGGGAVSEWSDEVLPGFEIACEARLRALNWLCGFGASWDAVPIEV